MKTLIVTFRTENFILRPKRDFINTKLQKWHDPYFLVSGRLMCLSTNNHVNNSYSVFRNMVCDAKREGKKIVIIS